jgi:hypothetical protein
MSLKLVNMLQPNKQGDIYINRIAHGHEWLCFLVSRLTFVHADECGALAEIELLRIPS